MTFGRQLLQACAKFAQHLQLVRNFAQHLLLVQNSHQPMRGAKSPLFCRLHFRYFLMYFFDVISFLILVTNQSQALLL